MPFSSEYYPVDLRMLMEAALDAATQESGVPNSELHVARPAMAPRIMSAIEAGERDPERLKRAALDR